MTAFAGAHEMASNTTTECRRLFCVFIDFGCFGFSLNRANCLRGLELPHQPGKARRAQRIPVSGPQRRGPARKARQDARLLARRGRLSSLKLCRCVWERGSESSQRERLYQELHLHRLLATFERTNRPLANWRPGSNPRRGLSRLFSPACSPVKERARQRAPPGPCLALISRGRSHASPWPSPRWGEKESRGADSDGTESSPVVGASGSWARSVDAPSERRVAR